MGICSHPNTELTATGNLVCMICAHIMTDAEIHAEWAKDYDDDPDARDAEVLALTGDELLAEHTGNPVWTQLYNDPLVSNEQRTLKCDGRRGCAQPITMIDDKGWIYCSGHGTNRARFRRARLLTEAELATLYRGHTIKEF